MEVLLPTDYERMGEVLMEYIEDLITASPKGTWNKTDLLVLLNLIKNDPHTMYMLRQMDARDRASREAV